MKTAIDTNAVSALLASEASALRVNQAFAELRMEGDLTIAACTLAELMAFPRATETFLNQFLEDTKLGVDFHLGEQVWREGGRRYARYAQRRRKSGGGEPKRFLADFLIGAHALLTCDRLFTLDVERYRIDFPELAVITI